MRRALPLILILGSCSFYSPDPGSIAENGTPEAPDQTGAFRSLVDAYLAWHYAVHPTMATLDGVHDHDAVLGDYSREAILGRVDSLRRYQGRLNRIDRGALEDGEYFDTLVLEAHFRAALLELETVRGWSRDPNFYRHLISSGLYGLSALAFDTPERRMALATRRLGGVPALLVSARANLDSPPRVLVTTAIDEFKGTGSFIDKDLTGAFESVKDADTRKEFDEARKEAGAALKSFVEWLEKDLLQRSVSGFAIGREAYAAKLLYEEMVDVPVDELLKRGYAALRATQEDMKRIAGSRPVRDLLLETSQRHPSAGQLLDATRATLEELKRWAGTVVDIPADAACKVQETPSFRRALSFASMEIPGPFERTATDAYYSVTLPDPAWDAERQAQHLRFFNASSLPIISVHEAYPGHYTQFLAVQRCPSKVRKVFGCASFSEGWAHYCEQLYAERPEAPPELRLQQLSLALLRICRYIAGIEMHVNGWSREKAADLFVNEGWQERAVAEREALRGTSDPTYLVYTLGKMEILRLREDCLRAGKGLRDFHNEFIRHGYPPIRIMRMILLDGRPR